jgi:two-component system, OmpR family, sensor histidine kinase KdpD
MSVVRLSQPRTMSPWSYLKQRPLPAILGYPLGIAACVVTAMAARPLAHQVDSANIVMLFLLTVFLVARYLGRGPSLMAAFVAVALFDFFFVPPHLTFAVEDIQYLITFMVMLAVAVLTGHLVARLGQQAEEALAGEQRMRALYEMARDLAGAVNLDQVGSISQRFLGKLSAIEARVFVPDANDKLRTLAAEQALPDDMALPQRAYQRGEMVERRGLSGMGRATVYLPLSAPMRVRGVLEVSADSATLFRERPMLDTVASLTGVTLERLHYVEVAQSTQLQMESERLRASVLSSLSHDLRTPLTAMVGLADTLALAGDALPEAHRESAVALRDQARHLSDIVGNLLDLARLSAGGLRLRKEWQPLEEVVGSAIKLLEPALTGRRITVDLPDDLPLLEFDSVLLERVIGNLLDNAGKHAPPGSTIGVTARQLEAAVEVAVADAGAGFPANLDRVEPFRRGSHESAAPGVGLGLSICKAILAAHGGELRLENLPAGGARASFTLPLGSPPALSAEAPEDAA